MSTLSNHLRVTLVQISAGPDIQTNLQQLKRLLSGVGSTDVIALPEVFAMRGSHQDYHDNAQSITGPLMNFMASIAHRHNAWVLAGSMIESSGQGLYNTSVLVNRRGEIQASYRKMHLFEAEIGPNQVIRESDTYLAGNTPVMVDVDGWQCGMAICYDVRFPELFRLYSAQGAQLFFIPANFTQNTGKDHWEVLLRARAIENQCFVIAPNQCGADPHTKVESYGHSMIIGPWGDILTQIEEGEGSVTVSLDIHQLDQTRRRIPALAHRKL